VAVAIADLNGDGHPDLVAINANANDRTGTLSISRGDGHGHFTGAVLFPLPFPPKTLAVADLDRDGITDLAIVSEAFSLVSLVFGTHDLDLHHTEYKAGVRHRRSRSPMSTAMAAPT